VAKQKKKAELFCKERLWVYNYVMKTTKNYTERPKEDPVTTRQMFKIVIYAAMNHIYSSRDIETA
jgi:transposase